jgi:glycosyltransferase involved in cell wall biosynthesis
MRWSLDGSLGPPDADGPLVSIVTPTLNQAGTLRETLRSVAAQTYGRVEHIVVDGGSTDGTLDILGSTPGIRWTTGKDRGQSDAINKGLRAAQGEIVAYLNSDDLLYPDAVATVVETLRAHPEVELVYGDGTVIDAEGRPLWEWLSRPEDWRLLAGYFFLWNDFTNYILQQATFWRRRLHQRVGYFDEDFHYAMDLEFWLRVGASGGRMLHLGRPLGKFRMAPGTKSLSSPTVFWEDHLELFRRYQGPPRMRRYVEQFLFEEMHKNGCTLAEAQGRYAGIVRRRWAGVPERARLEALGAEAGPGALVRLADHLWNAGREAEARAVLRGGRRSALLRGRGPLLAAKLLAGPLSPVVRRAWVGGIAAYRSRRYLYRYRAAGGAQAG